MSQFEHLSPDLGITWLEQGDAVWVDIRDPASFNASRIKGAIALDNANVADFIANTDKTTPVVVCCYHGNSSQQAAQFLAEQGFEKSYSLDGGFEQWRTMFPDAVES